MKGLQVKELRKKLGLNQEEFAQMLGVSKRTVINYEQSKTLKPSIAEYINYMVQKKGSPPPVDNMEERLNEIEKK